ncbi:hypothetical protein D3C72_2058370 [compost metagenome]
MRFQQDAQFIKCLEARQVDRHHLPAVAEVPAHQSFGLQAQQRLAHRRAGDAEPLGDIVLGEAVARQQAKCEDVVPQAEVSTLRTGRFAGYCRAAPALLCLRRRAWKAGVCLGS